MQEAGFQIRWDAPTKRINIRMFGHWSADTAAAFHANVHAMARALAIQGCFSGQYLSMIDARDYQVQTQEITKVFEELLSDPEILSKRIAFIPPAGLAKIQTKRLASQRHHKFFNDIAAAEEWLRAA